MSRPPNQYHDIPNHLGNRYYADPQIIDFKVGSPYTFDPSEYSPSSIYAQAGFPGYAQQPSGYGMPPCNQIASQATYPQMQGAVSQFPPHLISAPAFPSSFSPNYPPQMITSAAYPQMCTPQPVGTPASCQLGQQVAPLQTIQQIQSVPSLNAHASVDSEAVIQERIKANIDAIMETQKTAMLNSKLEKLTDKVQSLAQNIGSGESADVRSLSDRVERLSRNIAESSEGVYHIKNLSERVEKLSRNITDSGEGVHHIKGLSQRVEQLSRNIAESGEGVHQIKNLSEKVENLSRNINSSDESYGHVRSLAEKVDRLSKSIELSQKRPMDGPIESLSTAHTVSDSASDSDISRRLRRLAAESSARQARSEDRIPDW